MRTSGHKPGVVRSAHDRNAGARQGHPTDLVARAAALGGTLAGNAEGHDCDGTFVEEALDAFRAAGLLTIAVPARLGGEGATLRQGAALQRELSHRCGAPHWHLSHQPKERWLHMFSKRMWPITMALAVAGVVGAMALPSVAQTAPIVVEQLGVRSVFTDRVELKFKVKDHDGGMTVVSTQDASRTAVARITVQPGARFPWHTHPGPLVVNIGQGALTYVEGDDCHERTYNQGEAFVDSGHGHVHSAYNPGTTVTIVYATFFEAPPEPGLLTIPAPTPDCAQ